MTKKVSLERLRDDVKHKNAVIERKNSFEKLTSAFLYDQKSV